MQPMVLPQGVAGDPPGPGLCALLAGLDPALVANGDTVALLQAWRRLRSYVDAHELAAMAEVGRCDPHATPGASARLAGPDPGCGQEIAAALTLTEQAAWREHALGPSFVEIEAVELAQVKVYKLQSASSGSPSVAATTKRTTD